MEHFRSSCVPAPSPSLSGTSHLGTAVIAVQSAVAEAALHRTASLHTDGSSWS